MIKRTSILGLLLSVTTYEAGYLGSMCGIIQKTTCETLIAKLGSGGATNKRCLA